MRQHAPGPLKTADTAGIKRRMKPFCLTEPKKFRHKIRLRKRLAACDGDTAIF